MKHRTNSQRRAAIALERIAGVVERLDKVLTMVGEVGPFADRIDLLEECCAEMRAGHAAARLEIKDLQFAQDEWSGCLVDHYHTQTGEMQIPVKKDGPTAEELVEIVKKFTPEEREELAPLVFDDASDAARDPTMEDCPNCGEVQVWEHHDANDLRLDWYECKACHYAWSEGH